MPLATAIQGVGTRRRPGNSSSAHGGAARQASPATESVVAGGAPGRDEGTLHGPSSPGRSYGSISLFTIGYQGRSVEDYLGMLSRAHVTLLCDVRRNATSRKRGFSKTALAKACERAGIRYEHLPDLGISAERRHLATTDRGRQRMLAEYRRYDLANRPDSLEKILRWAASGESVAVTCFEREAGVCHRSLVAAEVERLGGPNITTEHLE